MTPVIEVRDLHKTYLTPGGPVPVLRGVNWQLRAGEFCAITGPSGSGKTTLLNLISLLDQPTRGEIYVEGREVQHADEQARIEVRKHKIGMIFQKFCLLPHRTAWENVLFRARYIEQPDETLADRARSIMDQLGLSGIADRAVRLLSGGEMQRVAIARALLIPPALLVADEPTGNLDRAAASAVMNALAGIHAQGIAVLLVTHNPSLLAYAGTHYECREGALWPVA